MSKEESRRSLIKIVSVSNVIVGIFQYFGRKKVVHFESGRRWFLCPRRQVVFLCKTNNLPDRYAMHCPDIQTFTRPRAAAVGFG